MITKTLDRNAFSTTEWMAVEHHSKRQEAIASEVASLTEQIVALRSAAALKVNNYEQSRLFRALRALRLL